MRVFSQTDIGLRREMNQDYFFTSEEPVGKLPNLFIVADGMGGHSAGDIASRTVVETMSGTARDMKNKDIPDILTECAKKANKTLREYAEDHPEMQGMGSTIICAVLEEQTLHAANVGDSRIYIVGDEIRQVTTDHSLVQEMLERGEIDAEYAKVHPDKNIITRAIGAARTVRVDTYRETLQPGELVVMCTDGLTNMVSDGEIREILTSSDDLAANTGRLVETANENGGKDNITVIVIDPEIER